MSVEPFRSNNIKTKRSEGYLYSPKNTVKTYMKMAQDRGLIL